MSVRADFMGLAATSGTRQPHLAIEASLSGYVVRPGPRQRRLAMWAERSGRLAGIALLIVSLLVWISPTMPAAPGPLPAQAGPSLLFLSFGLLLIARLRGGVQAEMRIDLSRDEIQLGGRDASGRFHPGTTLPFGQIASVFLSRSGRVDRPDRLFLRLDGGAQPLEIVSGREADLVALKERLRHDLTPRPDDPVPDNTVRPRRLRPGQIANGGDCTPRPRIVSPHRPKVTGGKHEPRIRFSGAGRPDNRYGQGAG